MILRFLLAVLGTYCLGSYLACAYVLWARRAEMANNQSVTVGDKMVGSIVFFLFAPLVVGEVLVQRLLKSQG